MHEISVGTVQARLAAVQARVAAAGADPSLVRIVAVTKGFGPAAVQAALAAGLGDLGESYAQELLAKAATAPAGLRWHYLGAPQRNKLARLAPFVSLWHGVDSEAAALALAGRGPRAAALVQVCLAPGDRRRGVALAQAPEVVRAARAAGLDIRGLMAVGRQGAGPQELADAFGAVAALGRRLRLAELSMGMSDDYEVAVSQGATLLRLGRALFGERPVDDPCRRGTTLGL